MVDKQQEPVDNERRSFVGKSVAGIGAATIAPGVIFHAVADAGDKTTPVSSKNRWGMLIDSAKCADGCSACVEACDKENGLTLSGFDRPKTDPIWIRKVKLKDNLTGHVTNLPMLCQHCENPPCADVCPTGASFRRADGIVLVDRHTCIGCRYCMMACPYKARSFIHEVIPEKLSSVPRGKGCVESCTLCVQRQDAGNHTTACQEACDKEGHNAIIFGDLNNESSELSQALKKYPTRQIRADLKLNTGVRYKNI